MIKAVIFDCFGVLCVGARTYMMQQCQTNRQNELSDLFDQADYGYVTTAEFNEQAAALLDMDSSTFDTMAHQRYAHDESMLALVRSLRRTHKTALLSNANDTIIGELFPPSLQAELFDEVVVSSSLGMIKPSRQLFDYTATRLDVLPEECVMVDDIARNITGAAEAGMDGIVFTDHAQCVRALAERGVHA